MWTPFEVCCWRKKNVLSGVQRTASELFVASLLSDDLKCSLRNVNLPGKDGVMVDSID